MLKIPHMFADMFNTFGWEMNRSCNVCIFSLYLDTTLGVIKYTGGYFVTHSSFNV